MLRRLKFFCLFFACFFLLPTSLKAQSEFSTDIEVNYDIDERGVTTITHKISLTNLFSNLYATSYSLYLEGLKPKNPRAFQGSQALDLKVSENTDGSVILKIDFSDALVGKGEKRQFQLVFENSSIATRTGEIWEISIPKHTDTGSYKSYFVMLTVPLSFDQLAYISPQASRTSQTAQKRVFYFDKERIKDKGVSAAFGKFQVFSFDLTYHLENPLNKQAFVEIAIPPDTAFQKLNYQKISPEPERVYNDEEGNWLAIYKLKPRERVDVQVNGLVQIFAMAREFPKSPLNILEENKKETEVWQVNDPQIKKLAENLQTPKAIYNFVTSTLSYSYERVKPNSERLGAKAALDNPKEAICTEFTDLFIALARAAGIPAREINGFAYTENPSIEPLSLVADVLHSWPEYWNKELGVWTPVDPTWGNTTAGVDFFSKLDLRHFSFVVHGKNPHYPYPAGSYKLGPNPQKDVFITFGQLPEKRTSLPQIIATSKRSIPFHDVQLIAEIKNTGPVAFYNQTVKILFDNQESFTQNIELLPPYGVERIPINVPFSLFGEKTPNNLSIVIAEQQVVVPTNKHMMLITSLIFVFLILFFTLLVVYILNRLVFKKK